MIGLEQAKKYFEKTKWDEGMELFHSRKVKIVEAKKVSINPMYSSEIGVLVTGEVKERNVTYHPQVVLGKTTLSNLECTCEEANQSHYWSQNRCKHQAALIRQVYYEKIFDEIDFYTSFSGFSLVNQYSYDEIVEIKGNKNEGIIEIEPILSISEYGWDVSFRVGTNKKYVVKNLTSFYQSISKKENVVYGKGLQFIHREESFKESSHPYLRFIMERIVEKQGDHRHEPGYGYETIIKKELQLTPFSLETLLDICEAPTIDYVEETMQGEKVKGKAKIVHKNPKLTLTIKPSFQKDGLEGVKLTLNQGNLMVGNSACIALQNQEIRVSDAQYFKAIVPLIHAFQESYYEEEISLGKDVIGTFYNEVLPKIKKYIEVVELDSEKVKKEIKEKPEMKFYFDLLEGKEVVCSIKVIQEDEELNFFDEKAASKGFGVSRNKVHSVLDDYVETQDRKNNLVVLKNDDDSMFEFITQGISRLQEIGSVHGTKEFLNVNIRRAPKVALGVRMKSDLLNIAIDTDAFDLNELQDILKSYKAKKKFHRLKDGSFMELQENAVESLAKILEGLRISVKEFVKGKMNIPAYRALYIDKILEESTGVLFERNSEFKKIIREFKAVSDSDFDVPEHLKPVLRGYQRTGYRWLCMLESYKMCGILADDMGLGKTLQVITLLVAKKERGDQGTSLIITPASLIYNWEKEFGKFAPGIKVAVCGGNKKERQHILEQYESYDVLITSYDLVRRDIEEYEKMSFEYKIIDEAQYIKNHITQISKSVKIVSAKYRLALTGTPIENRLSELWSIFDFLMPGFLYTYEKFRKEIEAPIVKHKDEACMEYLKKLVGPFILRRLKKDVLKDLPEKLEETTYAKLEEEQMTLYTAYVAKMKQELASQEKGDFSKNKLRVLAQLTKLRQICCDPRLAYDNYKGESGKLQTCMELVANALEGGHKLLLFSQFTSMLDILGEALNKEKISYYLITGATPKEKRQALVDSFNENDVPVFLISLKAGGTGLNLTSADVVIHYDPWWNVAAQNQATDRTHRIGQTNVVTVFQLIAKGTIEEKIMKLQETKKQLADQIISGEENQLANLTQEDFMELLE